MAPYCSLEPQPGDVADVHEMATGQKNLKTLDDWRQVVKQVEDHWGPQTIEIRGVPRDSRHAHMMLEADYHMKKVSLGLADFAGISSYLDRHISAMESQLTSGVDPAGSSVSMVRFWFHTRQGFPTYGEEADIVFLEACPMDVLTEKQNADSGGALSDSDQDDLHAISFAREFSQLLDNSDGRSAGPPAQALALAEGHCLHISGCHGCGTRGRWGACQSVFCHAPW